MDYHFLVGILLVIAAVVTTGSLFIYEGAKKNNDRKKKLVFSIVGWSLIVLTIVATIVGFIVLVDLSGGFFGTIIFTIISPLLIIGGFTSTLGIGISSLVSGYKKDGNGNRNHNEIIRGWSMLFLSVAIVASIIITLAILFENHSDTPIAAM